MASVSLQHIYKVYAGGVTAVSDFNLDIKDKEFIVLVGPSGCGKSTTLRMVAGLEEISDGELYIGDKLVNDVAPKDRDIAMVFQNYALYPHMTVFDNMAFGLKLRKTPKDEIKRRVEEAARVLGIDHLLNRRLCPAASVSVLLWAVLSSVSRRSSCSTNRCPTWTLSCACRCVPKSPSCISACRPPSSTLPMTRPKL